MEMEGNFTSFPISLNTPGWGRGQNGAHLDFSSHSSARIRFASPPPPRSRRLKGQTVLWSQVPATVNGRHWAQSGCEGCTPYEALGALWGTPDPGGEACHFLAKCNSKLFASQRLPGSGQRFEVPERSSGPTVEQGDSKSPKFLTKKVVDGELKKKPPYTWVPTFPRGLDLTQHRQPLAWPRPLGGPRFRLAGQVILI